MRTMIDRLSSGLLPVLLFAAPAMAQTSPSTPDIPPEFVAPTEANDYDRRTVMIPMRDGVRLAEIMRGHLQRKAEAVLETLKATPTPSDPS